MSTLHIYTDGASTKRFGKNIGGAAWYGVLDDNVLFYGSKSYEDATNNIAELKAIQLGLYMLIKSAVNFKKIDMSKVKTITIHSDSTYAIGVVSGSMSPTTNLTYINEVKVQLDRVSKFFPNVTLKFDHVKGHAGDKYNEMCDKMAKNKMKELVQQMTTNSHT